MTFPPGTTVFVCSRGGRRQAEPCKEANCGQPSIALCDWPLGGARYGKTCSRPTCSKHTWNQGPDRDFCPSHQSHSKLKHVWCNACHMATFAPKPLTVCGACGSKDVGAVVNA